MPISINDSIQSLPSIGLKRAEIFSSIGFKNIKDLLYYFPYKHLDRSRIIDSAKLAFYLSTGFDGEVTLVGRVASKEILYYGKKRLMKVIMKDAKGFFDLVWFNGVEYLKNKFLENETYAVSGKPVFTKYNHIQFSHPDFDKLENDETTEFLHTGKIIPYYKIPPKLRDHKLGDFSFRKLMHFVVTNYSNLVTEYLSNDIINKAGIVDLQTCINEMHFPTSLDLLNKAIYRIKFEELFFLELMVMMRKMKFNKLVTGNKFIIHPDIIKSFLAKLPFQLNKSQLKVLSEIRKDFESGRAMNRMLQGDVGSGKTIVAVICILISSSNNYQSVLTVPTEILARQHFDLINKLLFHFNKNIFLLIGGMTAKEKNKILNKINASKNSIVIGTHALFEENIIFNNLGFVAIDEQHKFGVLQRASIIKKGKSPHLLIMSATPIPRTLSMTLYGDLDVSIINELPMNRKPVKTFLRTEKELENIYAFIKQRISAGEQAFIVFPIIDESKDENLKSAQVYFEKLSKNIFNDYKVELIHGRMNSALKENIMNNFKEKKIQVLVSTTVIEVGIDIPDATVMLINNPERFGLSQLHQLRGRVGRGEKQSYCILIAKNNYAKKIDEENLFGEYLSQQQLENNKTYIRLNAFVNTQDGFELAELDLKLRGPGNIFGTEQSGMPKLKYAALPLDIELLLLAKDCVIDLLKIDPELSKPENKNIKEKLTSILLTLKSSSLIS